MQHQPIRIAINGFGRIGRRLFRLLLEVPDIQVVAINDLANIHTLSHLLQYDSIHRVLRRDIQIEANRLIIDGQSVVFSSKEQPSACDWGALDVTMVIEATGKFRTYQTAASHLQAGAQKIILSAPPLDDAIKTVVLGVNAQLLDGTESIISNASCTTNNAAPMIQIVHDLCHIEQAYITTVHSFTTDQSLHDQPHRDLRRARAATQSIVPTTTGAAKALTKIFPDLQQVIGGCGIRVPVPNGSLTDITCNVSKATNATEINQAFYTAASGQYKGILDYTEDPIVSVDVIGNTNSCIFDALMTSVIGKMVKIIGWYDNETAYSQRIIDLIRLWRSLF